MATGITIEIKADTAGFKREVKGALDTGSAQVREFKSAIDSANTGFGSMKSTLGGLKTAFAALGGAFILKEIAQAAIQSAIQIDKTRQTMVALTGSVDAANKKIAELRKLAASSPGVTNSFATDLFVQFKALKTVADTTINDLIKSIGKLNAVFSIPDVSTFSRNLIQIFQGGFERDQIKEAIQAVPIFEQLLQEAFGTSDGQKLKKLKDAGKLTMDTFLQGIIEQTNSRFKDVQDGIGSLFEKLKDRITVALEPLGQELTKILLPVFDDAVKKVEEYGSSAARIFAENRNDIITTAKEITLLIVELGKLIGKLGEVAAKSGIMRVLAVGAAATQDLLNGYVFSVGPREAAVNARFDDLEREQKAIASSPFLSGQVRDMGALGNSRAVYNSTTGQFELPAGAKTLTGGGGGATGSGAISASRRESAREQAERAVSRANIAGLQRNVDSRLRDLDAVTDELIKSYKVEIKAREKYSESLQRLGDATSSMVSKGFSNLIRNGKGEFNDANRDSSRAYSLQLQGVDDLFNRGAINPDDAEALRRQSALQRASALNSNLNGPNAKFIDRDDIQNLRDEAEHMTRLGTAVSETERFMRGFRSATISVGDAFERFGQNVAGALTNTKDLLNGLKQALLGFFNDLLGRSIQGVVGQALAPLAQIFGGSVFGGGAGGAGGGGAGGGGVLGNIFRTPSTVPQSISSSTLQNLVAATGGGIGVPASISEGQVFGDVGGLAATATRPRTVTGSAASAVGGAAGASGFSLGGFGKSLAGAAPFIGAGIGSSLGGQSQTGQIFGAAGGLLAGGAVAGFAGALGPTATALFTNPFTIAIGAGLLVGAYFLGKASQRKKDEEASGQYLTQALQSIDQLALGVQSGQIDGGQARQIFESQILGTFKQQISGLKTKSVVESRLTNQVRDLRKVFEDRIPPLIAEQQRKAADARRFGAIDSRLVPQFASGGFVGGIDRGRDSVMAMLRPGELVLNRAQQRAVIGQSNPGVFSRAGVPAVNTTGRYADGGYAQPASGGRSAEPIQITLNAVVDARGIYIAGATSEDGRRVNIQQEREQRLNRER